MTRELEDRFSVNRKKYRVPEFILSERQIRLKPIPKTLKISHRNVHHMVHVNLDMSECRSEATT